MITNIEIHIYMNGFEKKNTHWLSRGFMNVGEYNLSNSFPFIKFILLIALVTEFKISR